jgi:hypothetical protein
MSDETVIAVIVGAVILAVAALAAVLLAMQIRRHRLREKFGPEYARTVEDAGSRREAEHELTAREKRHTKLDLRPLPADLRTQYARDWTQVQERFVDAPETSVSEADHLVTALMAARGYPTEGYEQQLADLSVEHARTLDHYRAAHEMNERQSRHETSTEDLRQAMVHYRALFEDLLGSPGSTSRPVEAPGAGVDARPETAEAADESAEAPEEDADAPRHDVEARRDGRRATHGRNA